MRREAEGGAIQGPGNSRDVPAGQGGIVLHGRDRIGYFSLRPEYEPRDNYPVNGVRWSKELIPIRKRGAIWIMVGRPRKIGKRERNGRMDRAIAAHKKRTERAETINQPHRRGVVVHLRECEEAESEFGRLMLRGGITPAHFEAGIAFIRLKEAVRAVYDAASPNPQAMDLNRRAGFPGPGMTTEEGKGIKDRYMKAFDCAGEAGCKAQRTLAPHVIRNEPVTDFDTLYRLRAALDRLVRFFGIDPRLTHPVLEKRKRCNIS